MTRSHLTLLSAAMCFGLAVAPAAFAQDSMSKGGAMAPASDSMAKPDAMGKTDTMAKPGEKTDAMKKTDGMEKADAMKKTDGMSDKKDNMSDPMKK
jgi:pentapeptide MXKDX repeat protein